jgi:hypothetical protein
MALAGDLATDYDARRLNAAGITALSITTGSACHLDAEMVHHALHGFPWRDADFLFVENVGNLVCPAVYDLGQAVNVVALSVTEGPDKPINTRRCSVEPTCVAHQGQSPPPAEVSLRLRRGGADQPDASASWPHPGFGLSAWPIWLEARRAPPGRRRDGAITR